MKKISKLFSVPVALIVTAVVVTGANAHPSISTVSPNVSTNVNSDNITKPEASSAVVSEKSIDEKTISPYVSIAKDEDVSYKSGQGSFVFDYSSHNGKYPHLRVHVENTGSKSFRLELLSEDGTEIWGIEPVKTGEVAEYVVPKASKYYGEGEYRLRFAGTKGSAVKARVNVRSLTPNDI
ncbi:hypothetical protein P4V86_06355 [Brevibacillus laterosporus]|uniref:hypothetical protein n=1 Tax=Brevibacillus laterosporus TaxID=1465 RepID=UPI000370B0FE|nr:hypothetical protein [Brevibacillus laterosporus]ATO50847.1 hypothetical protein BrL25_18180 [Brevibacillus laterosporus DSM 25]MBG9804510.1 hypothetical protein [Brevibacillus laterosporus]MED2002981.1 hypothetical protein [Brevibacillus laterosporus]MED4763961.1 hypothetical protein [Brevibacillus laterosporus]TPH16996.1 hypothetical protein EGH09_10370 [Brevibacillus laterosporus]